MKPCELLRSRILATDFRLRASEKRETASHARNRPGKGVLSVVELTLRARSSALEARKQPKRDRAEARSSRP
jgi:hypothetical protein